MRRRGWLIISRDNNVQTKVWTPIDVQINNFAPGKPDRVCPYNTILLCRGIPYRVALCEIIYLKNYIFLSSVV